jgi:Bacterial regulatory protein, Fis family
MTKRDLLTQEMIIEALRASAGIVSLAAQKIGVARQTVHQWISSEPELKAAVDDIREINLDLCEAGLMKLIAAGDRESIRFYLRCFGK